MKRDKGERERERIDCFTRATDGAREGRLRPKLSFRLAVFYASLSGLVYRD